MNVYENSRNLSSSPRRHNPGFHSDAGMSGLLRVSAASTLPRTSAGVPCAGEAQNVIRLTSTRMIRKPVEIHVAEPPEEIAVRLNTATDRRALIKEAFKDSTWFERVRFMNAPYLASRFATEGFKLVLQGPLYGAGPVIRGEIVNGKQNEGTVIQAKVRPSGLSIFLTITFVLGTLVFIREAIQYNGLWPFTFIPLFFAVLNVVIVLRHQKMAIRLLKEIVTGAMSSQSRITSAST